jgi:hypothetical protein
VTDLFSGFGPSILSQHPLSTIKTLMSTGIALAESSPRTQRSAVRQEVIGITMQIGPDSGWTDAEGFEEILLANGLLLSRLYFSTAIVYWLDGKAKSDCLVFGIPVASDCLGFYERKV